VSVLLAVPLPTRPEVDEAVSFEEEELMLPLAVEPLVAPAELLGELGEFMLELLDERGALALGASFIVPLGA
jgi:hypothetical protein